MRLILISTPIGSLGSGKGGGVELTVISLIKGLIYLGHVVKLIAPLGSKLPSECYLIKTTLPGYTNTRKKLISNATDVFNIVRSGGINVSINHKYYLEQASLSHINLESRKTTGSSILVM